MILSHILVPACAKNKLEDLKVLKRPPDLLINVKIGEGRLPFIYFMLPNIRDVAILVSDLS